MLKKVTHTNYNISILFAQTVLKVYVAVIDKLTVISFYTN